uniref:J domain-containing protein n=1 Tax=Graphocephala atropunctata TaxID=36148 RepID=A0A1B6LVV7_9HEMI
MNLNRKLNYKLVRQFSVNVSEYQRKNHYDCLGITPKATQGDVKSAYYKLSKQYHPDLNTGNTDAADKFRDITEAYEVLGNLKTRKLYDRGLFIGGADYRDHSYKSDKPVVDNYEHSSFYHHRNKPASRRSESESSPHYNIDEWTRAHYSKTFQQSYNKRSEGIKNVKDQAEEWDQNKSIWQVIISVFVFTTAFFFYGTRQNYDVSLDLKPDEKPD